MSNGIKPDYNLAALNKTTGEKNTIGAAWTQADGRISIKLNAFVTLQAGPDLVLSLFKAIAPPAPVTRARQHVTEDNYDDDIPF
jgi:hypothetical protein